MSKLSIDLADKLRELRDRFGLEVTGEQYDENNFGNAYVILTADFVMRILRERGQVFIDFAKPNQNWAHVNRKVESLGLHPNPESVLSTNSSIYFVMIRIAFYDPLNPMGQGHPR